MLNPNTNSTAPQGHSVVSPSSGYRWSVCPASIIHNKQDQHVNEDNKEGILAHKIAAYIIPTIMQMPNASPEKWIKGVMTSLMPIDGGPEASDFLDGTPVTDALIARAKTAYPNMLEAITEYVSSCVNRAKTCIGWHVESKISVGEYTSEIGGYGTSDFFAYDHATLYLDDLKFGFVSVEAEDNIQCLLYSAGALDMIRNANPQNINIKNVEITIHQPKNSSVSTAYYTVKEIYDLCANLKSKGAEALYLHSHPEKVEEKHYVPSEKGCKYCKHLPKCKRARDKVLSTVITDFDAYNKEITGTESFAAQRDLVESTKKDSLIAVQSQSLDSIGLLLLHVPFIESWCKAINKAAYEALQNGENVPGFKLIKGRLPAMKWTDEKEVLRLIAKRRKGKELTVIKPLSPAKIRDTVKNKDIKEELLSFATRSEPSLKMVPFDAKGEDVNIKPVTTDEFEEVNAPEPVSTPKPDAKASIMEEFSNLF